MLGLFHNTTIGALEQTASFAQKRHELLAGNVANLDTPGYRSRDLDVNQFQAALAESIEQKEATPGVLGIAPTTRDDRLNGPRDAMETIVFHDDSDVSLEHQVTEISKNQHLHNLAISTMRSQFALLEAAITERA
ncbi:MAG: flagellar basal body rod protein FlgB [Planctomycetota bacterium]